MKRLQEGTEDPHFNSELQISSFIGIFPFLFLKLFIKKNREKIERQSHILSSHRYKNPSAPSLIIWGNWKGMLYILWFFPNFLSTRVSNLAGHSRFSPLEFQKSAQVLWNCCWGLLDSILEGKGQPDSRVENKHTILLSEKCTWLIGHASMEAILWEHPSL